MDCKTVTHKNTISDKSQLTFSGLVLLDLDGVLVHRDYLKHSSHTREQDMSGSKLTQYKIGNFRVSFRPGCFQFLVKLANKGYHIGFFSSTTHRNANPMVGKILNDLSKNSKYKKKVKKSIMVKYFRDRNRWDPEGKPDSYKVIKMLSDVWSNPIANPSRLYNKDNTLIVDDELAKVRYNDPGNYIVCTAFLPGQVEDKDFFQSLLVKIDEKVAKLRKPKL